MQLLLVAPFILYHRDLFIKILIRRSTRRQKAQGETATDAARTSISHVNVNMEVLDSQHCQTRAALIV